MPRDSQPLKLVDHVGFEKIASEVQIYDLLKTFQFIEINQGGLTSVYKTEIVQNLVHHERQCLYRLLYSYISAGIL